MLADEWKWKFNIPELMRCCESSAEGKFTVSNAYVKNQNKSQINNLPLQLKKLENEEQTESKTIKRNEIIKIRAEIKKRELRETVEKINKSKTGSSKTLKKLTMF